MGNIIDKIPVINRIGNKKSEMPPVFEDYEGIEDIVNKTESGVDRKKEIDVDVLIKEIPNPRKINTPGELIFFTDRFEKSCDNILKIKSYEDRSRFADVLYERLQKVIYLGKYWEKENVKELTKLRYWSELSSKYKVSKIGEYGAVKEPVIQ